MSTKKQTSTATPMSQQDKMELEKALRLEAEVNTSLKAMLQTDEDNARDESEWENQSEFSQFKKFEVEGESFIGKFIENREFTNKSDGNPFLANLFEQTDGVRMWLPNNHSIAKFLQSPQGIKACSNGYLIKFIYTGKVKVKKGFVSNFEIFTKKA